MQYNMIYNNPIDRRKSTYPYVLWNIPFSDEELENIISLEKNFNFTESKTFGSEELRETPDIRRSKIHFIQRNQETGWIFDRFNNAIKGINDEFYGFDLNGYNQIQYTVYSAEDQGMYDWHMDTFLGRNDNKTEDTRKMSLVMLLSDPSKDFVGGDFLLNYSREDNAEVLPLSKGRIVAFPSFLLHKVKPVIRGVRKSLVIWVEGPKFK
jgi:PKHD-type hydroxylase